MQHRQEEIERKEREAAMAKKQSEAEHKKELVSCMHTIPEVYILIPQMLR